MEQHGGGCLCGQVRYSFQGEPLIVAVCHCRHCQRQSGSAFSLVVAVPDGAVVQTGPTRTFLDRGTSGQPVHRVFCPQCGSPIVSRIEVMPGVTFIKAGTLDDPGRWTPSLEVFCAERWPWLPQLAAEQHARSNLGDGE
ncbi:MAG: GFA family protein [Pseudomonadota bacterium]